MPVCEPTGGKFPPECPQGYRQPGPGTPAVSKGTSDRPHTVGKDGSKRPHPMDVGNRSPEGKRPTLRAMSDLSTRSSQLPQGLADDLAACRAPAGEAATLPPACYADPEVHALEEAAIFRRGWIGVGRSDTWSANGDYRTFELGGVPIIVVRDDDGRLRAYGNSCSHRSSRILEGEGTCARIRCRFHFWTYGLDGRLIGAPSMQRTPGFDTAEHGLTEFALSERHGFALVSLEEEPPAIDDWLGDFGDLHADWPLSDVVTTRRREFTVDCNWKAFAEVFNEYYHLPYVHPDSIDGTYDEPDDPEQVDGAYASHFGTTVGTGGLLDATQDQALPAIPGLTGRPTTGVRYSWLFPNLMVALGREALWMYEVYPDGPDRCRCAQVVCFPQATIDAEGFEDSVVDYYERFDTALGEDIPMLVQQHAGQRSPFARQGRFSYLESNVAAFADWYAGQLLTVH